MHLSLDTLPWIKKQGEKGGRTQISIMGVPGWLWYCGEVFLIGIQVKFQQKWLNQLCLLLVACDAAMDDALVLEEGKCFHYRRYDAALSTVEIEAQLNNQLALVQILEHAMNKTSETISSINGLGKLA